MSVFAPAASFIWQTVESYGLDPDLLFAAEGISLEIPGDPQARISYDVLDRVRARAVEILGIDTFGLRVADYLHPSHFGALGYAWLASSTLRSAFERLSNFIKLFNDDAEIILEEIDGFLVVTDIIYSDSMNFAARDDTTLAILVQMCRFNCGRSFSPQQVWIRHEAPPDPQPWHDFFGCPVNFGAPENRFSIPVEIVDGKLPTANAQLAVINDQLIARDVARLERVDIVTRVRSMFTEKLSSGCFSENCIAGDLKMTVRTMHRKLTEKGTNFRTLLAEVRESTAVRYLRDPNLTLTEIAFLLGFSQASSFSRAYRSWTGESPSETRRRPAR